MAGTRILLLHATGLTVFRCDRSGTVREGRFGEPDELRGWLAARRRERHLLLANLADESFEALDIPHARGRQRAALVARKLAQHCPGTPFSAALPLGHGETGRKDERIVCAAINCPEAIEPWLRAIDAAEVALAGIYSLAQVVAHLPLGQGDGSFLALTLTHSGLRQTFVANGRLRFSRLTALSTNDAAALGDACWEQALNIHRYLCAQHLVERGAPLRVMALVHREQADICRARCANVGDLQFEFPDPAEIASRCGLVISVDDFRLDLLFAHQLGRRLPQEQLAPAAIRRRWRLKRLGQAIDRLGLAVLAGSCCVSAFAAVHIGEVRQNGQQLAQQNEAYRQQCDRTHTPSRLAPEQRELVLAYRELRRTSPPLEFLLAPLATALDRFPAVTLAGLDWQLVSERDGQSGAFAVLDVRGAFPAAEPGIADQLPLLKETLASPFLDVRVTKLPFALASDQSFNSADGPKQDGGFALRISGKL
jgi:hypothetical protein